MCISSVKRVHGEGTAPNSERVGRGSCKMRGRGRYDVRKMHERAIGQDFGIHVEHHILRCMAIRAVQGINDLHGGRR